MGVSYRQADDEVRAIVERMMAKYHKDLVAAEVTIYAQFATSDKGAAVKAHGWPCFAKTKRTTLEARSQGAADAIITIDGEKWKDLGDPQRNALIDHELEHIDLQYGGIETMTGKRIAKTDDLGRPVFKMRPHDYELAGFVSVAERHEQDAIEVHEAKEFKGRFGKQLMLEFSTS